MAERRVAFRSFPLILALLLLLVAGVFHLASCGDDELRDERPTTSAGVDDKPGDDAQSTGAQTYAVTKVVDLGKTQLAEPDPGSVVTTDEYGPAPANEVLVVMEEGLRRSDADDIAAQIDGAVVGEIEFLGLYQIQTSGSTAPDLERAIQTVDDLPGVKWALPNGLMASKVTVPGRECSPLHDPVYEAGNNAIPYQMIGMVEAWRIIWASGVALKDSHVGVVDSAIYTQSGHDLTPELYLPDPDGAFPETEVRIQPLRTKDITDFAASDDGGLTHGTEVTHVLAADWGEGVTGVAAGLADKLTVTVSNWHTADMDFDLSGLNPATAPKDALYAAGFYGQVYVEIIRQIEVGAKVINLSLGPDFPDASHKKRSEVYEYFFKRMYQEHPEVLFVAAAGNEGGKLDGNNYGPGGIPAPNLITVGALDLTGDRADAVDWYGESALRKEFERRKAANKIDASTTLDEWIKTVEAGSNYATGNGEVTLSACGTNVPVGRNPDGTPLLSSGTSFSAPQVTAAAGMLKSIDPTLTAEQIKDILVRTAATKVTVNGASVDVPADVGGKVLRVDRAVLEAINRLRGPGKELVYDELIELATVSVRANGDPSGYVIEASVPRMPSEGVYLAIVLNGSGEILGDKTQHLDSTSQRATWTVVPAEKAVTVKIYRLDSYTCGFVDLEGEAQGSSTSTDAATDNAPPVAEDITTSTGSASVAITLKGSDPDGDDLSYSVVRSPSHGRLTGSAPFLTYTPDTGFAGTDSFTYKVHDGEADSNAATVRIEIGTQGLRWVRSGPAVVNFENIPLEYYGGGATPDFFGEPRFEGMWLIYRVSETNFGVDDRWVDHGFESYNVAIDCRFDPPPPVLLPTKTYYLEARFTHSGTVTDGNPGEAFQYFCEGGSITPNESLPYYPWSPDPAVHVATKKWELTVPKPTPGATLVVQAGLWNAAPCNVTWTYVAE